MVATVSNDAAFEINNNAAESMLKADESNTNVDESIVNAKILASINTEPNIANISSPGDQMNNSKEDADLKALVEKNGFGRLNVKKLTLNRRNDNNNEPDSKRKKSEEKENSASSKTITIPRVVETIACPKSVKKKLLEKSKAKQSGVTTVSKSLIFFHFESAFSIFLNSKY